MDDFEKILELQQVDHAISLFGNFDENARIIEDGLNVKMISGDRGIRITGGSENVEGLCCTGEADFHHRAGR